jgi:hypothetical protein
MPAAAARTKTPPTPPDWSSFTINEDSRYAEDDQDAAALAQTSATELAGYLFSARLMEIAEREGRNPLVRGGRAYTPKQLDELKEGISDALNMVELMLDECARAFGDEAAELIRSYAESYTDAALDYRPDPIQQGLF